MAYVGEARFGGDLFCPLLHRPALHLHAPPALAAGQVVVVHARPALPVERLAAGVADGVDAALLAERLQVAVDGGEPDVLALAPQLRVDLLGAAEAGQALQRGRQGLRLPGPARPGAPGCPGPARAPQAASSQFARYNLGAVRPNARTPHRAPRFSLITPHRAPPSP